MRSMECPSCGGKKDPKAKRCRHCMHKPRGTPIKRQSCECCGDETITVPHRGQLLELNRYELFKRQTCFACEGRRFYTCETCDGNGIVGAEIRSGMVAINVYDEARLLRAGDTLREGEALHAVHTSCAASMPALEMEAA